MTILKLVYRTLQRLRSVRMIAVIIATCLEDRFESVDNTGGQIFY